MFDEVDTDRQQRYYIPRDFQSIVFKTLDLLLYGLVNCSLKGSISKKKPIKPLHWCLLKLGVHCVYLAPKQKWNLKRALYNTSTPENGITQK